MSSAIVVGGGVIGLSVAWRLRQRGHRVHLFDDAPGRGASYAAAGMLSPAGEAWFGETDLLRLGLASLDRWPEYAAELTAASGHDVWLSRTGTIMVAADQADAGDLDRVAGLLAAHRVRAVALTRRELRRLEPMAAAARASLHLPDELSVHNRRLLTALRTACARSGVLPVDDRADVVVADGRAVGARGRRDRTVRSADVTIISAGHELAGVAGVPGGLARSVRPVKGQILRVHGPADLLRHTVRALVRGRRVYAVPRRDGEVVVGASQEERDDPETVTVEGVHRLLDDALAVLPALRECEITDVLARARPGTPDNGPLIGATGIPGLLVAGGHHRAGVLLAPLTADAVADLVDGGPIEPGIAAFDPARCAEHDTQVGSRR